MICDDESGTTKRTGFAPIARADARVLILGTLPSKLSLDCGEYYANPRNSFWSIMKEIIGSGPDLPYEARASQLKDKRFALWDVYSTAHRAGSLDLAIVEATANLNDFTAFFSVHKCISLICFNGSKSEKVYLAKVVPTLPQKARAIRYKVLPSSSPARAMRFEEKLLHWQAGLGEVKMD